MPVERAAQIYDFARFLLSQPNAYSIIDPTLEHQSDLLDGEDWLNDSEEQMQAEDAKWEAAYTNYVDNFEALAAAARAEIQAGSAQPMFDDDGELVTDEVLHNP